MGMIFRMILNIFGEVFKQDARRRQEERARAAAPHERMAEQKSAGGGARGAQPTGFLQKVLAELEQLEAAQAPAAPQQPVRAPKPVRQPGVRKPESMEEHLSELGRLGERLEHQAESYLGVDLNAKVKPPNKLELPGKSALEKMIYAQVILGPCKARRGNGSIVR